MPYCEASKVSAAKVRAIPAKAKNKSEDFVYPLFKLPSPYVMRKPDVQFGRDQKAKIKSMMLFSTLTSVNSLNLRQLWHKMTTRARFTRSL